jgi:hypothetical protein
VCMPVWAIHCTFPKMGPLACFASCCCAFCA